MLVWFCRFPLPLGVWEGLRFVIVALPGLFSYIFYFAFVFLSPFSIAITSLGKERANLSVFRTFVRFALVWFCRFPLPLGVWEGLRFVIVALPGLFSYLCLKTSKNFSRNLGTLKTLICVCKFIFYIHKGYPFY